MSIKIGTSKTRHAGEGRHPRLFPIVLLFGLTVSGGAFASQPVYYEKPIQLSGTIVYEQFYGLPNFGENPKTDAKVNSIELKLDDPIDVFPSGPIKFIDHHCVDTKSCEDAALNSDSFKGVTRIGLIDLDYPALGLDKLARRHVVLSGALFEKEDALQFNTILMIVKTAAVTSKVVALRKSQ